MISPTMITNNHPWSKKQIFWQCLFVTGFETLLNTFLLKQYTHSYTVYIVLEYVIIPGNSITFMFRLWLNITYFTSRFQNTKLSTSLSIHFWPSLSTLHLDFHLKLLPCLICIYKIKKLFIHISFNLFIPRSNYKNHPHNISKFSNSMVR